MFGGKTRKGGGNGVTKQIVCQIVLMEEDHVSNSLMEDDLKV